MGPSLPVLATLLLGCGDAPTPPSASAPVTAPALAPPGNAPRVPADAPELPAALRCGDGRGTWGCFRSIPGGTFLMGAQAADPSAPGYDPAASPEEGPVRQVTVSTFWLQNQEVSARQLQQCVDAGWCDADHVLTEGGLATVGRQDDKPAAGVTWEGAARYCAWFGARLPTEAEWEYAARGPEGRRFPWGDDPRCPARLPDDAPDQGAAFESVLHVCDGVLATLRASREPHQVQALLGQVRGAYTTDALAAACLELRGADADAITARFQARITARAAPEALRCAYTEPSSLADLRDGTPDHQVYGLAGNVAEWTADWYGPRPPEPATDPTGPAAGEARVQKGGTWMADDPLALRAAVRTALPPGVHLPDVGFRCAWAPPR